MTEDSVLTTLRRVPDRIILAVMGRPTKMNSGNCCLCGWVVREALAAIRDVDAEKVKIEGARFEGHSGFKCAETFGGTDEEWNAIYWGVQEVDNLPIIECAFVRRVDEAVSGSTRIHAR